MSAYPVLQNLLHGFSWKLTPAFAYSSPAHFHHWQIPVISLATDISSTSITRCPARPEVLKM